MTWRQTPLKHLGGLFELYQRPDGTHLAMLTAKSQRLSDSLWYGFGPKSPLSMSIKAAHALANAWRLDNESDSWLDELIADETKPFEKLSQEHKNQMLRKAVLGHNAALWLGEIFARCLVPNFAPKANRGKDSKVAKKMMNEVMDCLILGRAQLHRGKAHATIENTGYEVPLPWLALELARRFSEEHQELPSKRELRNRMESCDPRLRKIKGPTWAKILREAGLSDLERSPTWSSSK